MALFSRLVMNTQWLCFHAL